MNEGRSGHFEVSHPYDHMTVIECLKGSEENTG